MQRGVTVVETEQGGGKHGAPLTRQLPQQRVSGCRHWGGELGTSGVREGEGGGSSHPGALRAACWSAPALRGGDGQADDEMVWRGDRAGAWLGGCAAAALV